MIGMLWYDKSAQAIENAIAYCEAKYGVRPKVCHVNPSHTLQGTLALKLQPDKTIMRDCYWLVIGE